MKQLLLITVICIYVFSGNSQNNRWYNYSKDQHIHSLIHHNDDIWVTTNIGLIQIDENIGIERFNSSYNLNSIVADSNGVLWIGSETEGIMLFEDDAWTWVTTTNGLPSNAIRSISIDLTGYVWVATNSGLAKYDGSTWEIFKTVNSDLPSNDVAYTHIDNLNNKWIGTIDGLVKIGNNIWEVFNTTNSGLPNNNISSISSDDNNVIWVGTNFGIGSYDMAAWQNYNTTNSGLPGDSVNSIAVDNLNNNVWIGTQLGLASFNISTWDIFDTQNSSLPDNNVNALFFDESNGLYIGTDNGGIVTFSDAEWEIINPYSGLKSQYVQDVGIDSENNKWMTAYDGVYKLSNTGEWTSYFEDSHFYDIGIDLNDNIWACSTDGVYRFDQVDWIHFPSIDMGLPSGSSIKSVAFDNLGNVWFGSWGEGLIKYDGVNWEALNTFNSGIPANMVLSVSVDNNNLLWVGTGNGLATYDEVYWTIYDESNSQLPDNSIYDIFFDSNTGTWIGTHDGLVKIVDDQWTVINSGIQGNYVQSINEDVYENMWFTTGGVPNIGGAGVSMYDGYQWINYSNANSGIMTSNNVTSLCIDESSNIFFGVNGGGLSVIAYNDSLVTIQKRKYEINNDLDLKIFPNPTRYQFDISYSIPEQSIVSLSIYNSSGEMIECLHSNITQVKGQYQYNISMDKNGIYLIVLNINGVIKTKKLIVN